MKNNKQAKFRLKGYGKSSSLSVQLDERVPLMVTDIQQLMLHTLLGTSIAFQPTPWYVVEKKHLVKGVTCLVFEGVSVNHWKEHNESFEHCQKIFKEVIEIVTPSFHGGSLVEELAAVPLSDMEKESLIKKYGNLNLALQCRKDLMKMMKAVFPIKHVSNDNDKSESPDNFPRTQLIMSAQQLIEENYPLPLKGKLKNIYLDYVMTKNNYQPVTPHSPMFAIDCEMCITSIGSELTRVSVVNEKHEVIYESLVKPYNEITDYLTHFSGINKSKLENVEKRIEDVQKELKKLLPPDAILVGQSLNSDLQALKMMHPYIIDTSIIFNFTGERSRRPKLRTLAFEFLNETIQNGKNGHCSEEDALACMKLVQLKLRNSIEFGDAVHDKNKIKYKSVINSEGEEETQYASTIFNHFIQQKKKSLIVGCDDITGDYHGYLTRAMECSNTQMLSQRGKPKKVKLHTVDTQDDVITTICDKTSQFDFIMGHLKIDVSENEMVQMKQLDTWLSQTYKAIKASTLFVVIFSGSTGDNGIALITVK